MAQARLIREESSRDWAMAYAVHRNTRGQRLDFRWHAWQPEIFQDRSRETVLQSCVQSGKSERNIIKAMAHLFAGHNVIYVLPTIELRNRFVAARIDPLLDEIPFYRVMRNEAQRRARKGKDATDAVGMKQLGAAAIAFVGSNAQPSLREFVADVVIVDELDQCDQKNIVLARDRVGHSDVRGYHVISNPTISNFGIDAEYAQSTQGRWHLKCRSCRHWQHPTWWDNVVVERDEGSYQLRCNALITDPPDRAVITLPAKFDAPPFIGAEDLHLVCRKCGKPLDRFGQGKWVHAYPKRDVRGYHISQLFAGTVSLREMWKAFQRALTNETHRMRFYNSVLGEAYESEGAKISQALLDRCVRDYAQQSQSDSAFMGVDVGSVLHIIIISGDRVIRITTLRSAEAFTHLDDLMKQYNVGLCVIDADPETRSAYLFAKRWQGRVLLCRFAGTAKVDRFKVDYDNMLVTADRTQMMDESHSVILGKSIMLPRDAASIAEFYPHMCAPTRIFVRRSETDSGRFAWVEGSAPDHYRMAFLYVILAKLIRASHGSSFVHTFGEGVYVG